MRTHVFLCQCRPYYLQHTTMEYRMIYHGSKINIFQSINVLLITHQCQKALERWQVFALSSKNNFFSRCFHWNIDIQECIIVYWKEELRIINLKSFRNFVFKYFIITKFFSSCFSSCFFSLICIRVFQRDSEINTVWS